MSIQEEKYLERFVVRNSLLEALEKNISEFNVFEAIGATRQELRHSDFLAFLFNPSENHSLGDHFLKIVLKDIIFENDDLPISAVDIDVTNLENSEVRREWQNIDILVLNHDAKIAIVIENKVDAAESAGQLERYYKRVQSTFQEYQIIPIYLTPEGLDATAENWVSYNYGAISEILTSIIDTKNNVIGQEILFAIKHYNEILRRHVMVDSKVKQLCEAIYKEHKTALDLIFEYRPDFHSDISDYLQQLIQKKVELILDSSSKTYIRFSPTDWDIFDIQFKGSGWTESKRILLFEFQNYDSQLNLKLLIGPGPDAIREHLFNTALQNTSILRGTRKTPGKKWTQIHKQMFLSKNDFKNQDSDKMVIIDKRWEKFLANELQLLTEVFYKSFKSFSTT